METEVQPLKNTSSVETEFGRAMNKTMNWQGQLHKCKDFKDCRVLARGEVLHGPTQILLHLFVACAITERQNRPQTPAQLHGSPGLGGWGIAFRFLAYFKAINIRDYHLHCATGTCQMNDCTVSVQRTRSLGQSLGCPWVLPSSFEAPWTMNIWCLWAAKLHC